MLLIYAAQFAEASRHQYIVSQSTIECDGLRMKAVFGNEEKGASNIDAYLQYQAPHSALPIESFMIYLLKIVIFYSYARLPEDIWPKMIWS